MNTTKKVLLASTLSLLGLTLASCSKQDVRNQVIPYEGISENEVAKVGKYKITEKELYNKLRYSYGQQVFNQKLDELLYSDFLSKVEYKDQVKIEIDEEIAKAVYNTIELPKLKLMSKEDASLARKKFVDKMSRQGLHINEEELVFDPITKQTENVSFSHLSTTTIDYYKLSQAKKLRGKEYITSVADKEYITKNDKEVKNNYYIDDKKIEARYESNYRKYNDAKGIILRYTNASDALRAIDKVTNGAGLGKGNLEESYVALYNDYYNYEDKELTAGEIGVNENTIFKTNSEVSQLTAFSSKVDKLFIEELENGEGLLKPINIDDKYYLIYRKDVTFKTGESKDIPYNQLKATLGEDKFNEIRKEVKNDIIDNDARTVYTSIYNEDLEDKELKIYDPFIENNFAGTYSFYEYVQDTNTKYIFTSKNNEYSYTVEEFYKDLLQYDVDSAVVDLLLNKYLYTEQKQYLEKDEEKKFKDELATEVKEFKKGNKNLNKAYGEENYLFFQYGVTTQEAVVEQKAAAAIKNDYLIDYISNEWAKDDHTFNTENERFFENLIDVALEALEEKKLFDINLDHILISVDNDQDGTPDNMLEFMDTLTAEEKAQFIEAINKLSRAIANEVEKIQRPNTKEKLDYIVKAFNNNWNTVEGKSWKEYKTYHFTLTAEALGNIDENSVNNFVKEFKEYVEELFDKAVRTDLKIDYDKEKDGRLYFTDRLDKDGKVVTEVTTANFEAQDLCLTQFGYHMISLNSYKKDSTTLNFNFTKNQDTAGDYNNIKVMLDEKDKDNKNDDIYILTDIYNDNANKPSVNQVLVYYIEKINGEVTSIKTNIKNNLSTLLDEVISKYQSTSFQQYLLIKSIGTFESSVLTKDQFDINRHLEYLKNTNENYNTDSFYYNNWYDRDWTRK